MTAGRNQNPVWIFLYHFFIFSFHDCGTYGSFFYLGKSEYTLPELEAREEEVDDIVDELQEAHIRRLENGSCSAEVGMLYQEILTDLERIADHAVNIAQAAEK